MVEPRKENLEEPRKYLILNLPVCMTHQIGLNAKIYGPGNYANQISA